METEIKRVRFIGCTDGQMNWGSNSDPRKFLEEGQVYDVAKVDVHNWHTKIYLVGFENELFNSVCFEEEYCKKDNERIKNQIAEIKVKISDLRISNNVALAKIEDELKLVKLHFC